MSEENAGSLSKPVASAISSNIETETETATATATATETETATETATAAEVADDKFKFFRETLNSPRFIIAPMVDQSELPWRMLSRKYGAQLCYTPMMHAGVFVRDKQYRQDNFVTCVEDRPLITQFCTDSPELFVQAGKLVENECDAVDLNLGCPQMIARRGHYGAFLQDEWPLVHSILKAGVDNLKCPVTAKCRVFESIDKSVAYAKMLESTGISLLVVHGRLREQKGANTGLASWQHIAAVKRALKIPVVANGNILRYSDLIACMKETGCDGVMIAEPNLYNPAITADLHPSAWVLAKEYVDLLPKYPACLSAIRGHLFKMFHKIFETQPHLRERLAVLKEPVDMYKFFDEIRDICLGADNQTKKQVEDAEDQKSEVSSDNATTATETATTTTATTAKTTRKLNYWDCQAYIRPAQKLTVNVAEAVAASEKEQDPAELAKLKEQERTALEEKRAEKCENRKKRKAERVERKLNHLRKIGQTNEEYLAHKVLMKKRKYEHCAVCQNPRSGHCEFSMCRKCCKDHVWSNKLECKGHNLKWREKEEKKEEPLRVETLIS